MLKEFKEFAMKGNVLDLAVGIIIGAAFTGVVNSFVNDVLTPPLGRLTGGVDFSNLFLNISGQYYATLKDAKAAGAATINYGLFINAMIQFAIVAFAVFLLVKQVNRFRGPAVAPPVSTKDCPFCATAIPLKASRCPNCTSALAPAS